MFRFKPNDRVKMAAKVVKPLNKINEALLQLPGGKHTIVQQNVVGNLFCGNRVTITATVKHCGKICDENIAFLSFAGVNDMNGLIWVDEKNLEKI